MNIAVHTGILSYSIFVLLKQCKWPVKWYWKVDSVG